MNESKLRDILTDYERKRDKADRLLEKRKLIVFSRYCLIMGIIAVLFL